MKRISKSEMPKKLVKKRGFYFAQLDKDLSIKYRVPILMINMLRTWSVFHEKSREEIVNYYKEKLLNPKNTSNRRKQFLLFVMSLKDDEYKDITRLTKYDWNYEGEDSKLVTLI